MSSTALLVIEGLWWTPEQKPKRPSVLLFLKGLKVTRGDFNIYYSNFYEKNGFKRALSDDLTNTREDRLFLYVAAHGTGKELAAQGKNGNEDPRDVQGSKNCCELLQY